jgi:hypothetical protein
MADHARGSSVIPSDTLGIAINSRFQPKPGEQSKARFAQGNSRSQDKSNSGAAADGAAVRPMGPMDQPIPNPGSSQSTAPGMQDPSLEAGRTPHSGPNYVTSPTSGDVKVEEAGAEQFDLEAVRHSLIAGQIKYDWERNKQAKQVTDGRLLACLRMRKGVYSPSEVAEMVRTGSSSTIYMPIAATKCSALASWLKEILMSPGDRPCGLEPRHLPQLPPQLREMIKYAAATKASQQMAQAAQAGGPTLDRDSFRALAYTIADEMEDQIKTETRRRANVAAEKMETTIFQQMDDGGFDGAFAEFIEYFSTYPTAFLKGPYTKNTTELKWMAPLGDSAEWTPMVETSPKLYWKAISPFDVYPAPLARDCQDRAFIERMRLSYEELFDCIGVPGFDEEAVRWACNNHQGGLLRNWIWTDAERIRLENDTTFDWFCKDDLVDALHYWGALDGRKLTAWGVKSNMGELDPENRYQIEAILIGTRVVCCRINEDPLKRRPYRGASYEEIPGSLWGKGVPEMCAAEQDACNALARAIINNAGIASGPQVAVNVDRIPPNEKIKQMYPWKMWQFNKPEPGQTGAAANPIQFFQPDMNADRLWKLYEGFLGSADDSTGIPRYSYGDEKVGGAGQTASGLSMLMGSAARRIRRAIGNIDQKVMAETVYDVFVWCMLHVDDPQIKGDCNVVPKGSAALLIKEQMQQGRAQGMQLVLSNPLVQQLAGMSNIADMLRDFFKGLHFPPDFIPRGSELQKIIEQIQQRMANPPPSPAMLQAQAHAAHDQSREKIEGAKLAQREHGERQRSKTQLAIAGMRYGRHPNPNGGAGISSGDPFDQSYQQDQQDQQDQVNPYVQAQQRPGNGGPPPAGQPGF